MSRRARAADPRTWGLPRYYPPTRCGRCGRNPSGQVDADLWNHDADAGVIVGYICPDCQTDADRAEAVMADAMIKEAFASGRPFGPIDPATLTKEEQGNLIFATVEARARRVAREHVDRARMAGDDGVLFDSYGWAEEVLEHPSFRDQPEAAKEGIREVAVDIFQAMLRRPNDGGEDPPV